MKMRIGKGDALIVVDVQNDFVTGTLPVPGAEEAIQKMVEWIGRFHNLGLSTHYTIDWHPPDHSSFKSYGGTWPVHCVQNTWGAEFHERIITALSIFLTRFTSITKGETVEIDEYSGFRNPSLNERLVMLDVNRVFIVGLATDYCVKATAMDAVDFGYEVIVVSEAIAGVNLEDGNVEKAIEEMTQAGVTMLLGDE